MSQQLSFDFTGKVAIITGATGGIGQAAALGFAEAGADLLLADVRPKELGELATTIQKLGRRAEVANVDVRVETQVEAMADQAVASFGHIDYLLNTAGVIKRKPSLEYTLEEWDWVVDVSLKGTWLCCQKVGAIMVRQGSGAIVNFASGAGMRGLVGYPAYGPAKAGIINLTKGLALEWGRQGVRVNAISPGFINSPLNSEILADPARLQAWIATNPLAPKPIEPEELVPTLMFLVSDGAKWITGVTLPVDGGKSAQ